jgi:KaiC/GvpD/RAD55 family RecA-like ATPase
MTVALSKMGRAALIYAQEFGWAVFPLVPREKRPLTANGLKNATTDAEQIAAWWTRHPDANIGMATGEISGVVVVDVDGPDGEAALATFGDLPVTPVSSTGKGRHLLFARPDGGARNTASKLGRSLDTRGDGGYIVVPPSVHPSGAVYAWHPDAHPRTVTPASLPEPLRVAMTATASQSAADLPAGAVAARDLWTTLVPDGEGRDPQLFRFACHLLAKGIAPTYARLAVESVNRENLKPPLPPETVEKVWRNALARHPEALTVTDTPSASFAPIGRAIFSDIGYANERPVEAVPTPLPGWNHACRGYGGGVGMARGWNIVAAGASGTGKSLLALNVTDRALSAGVSVAYLSLEMSAQQLLARLLAMHSGTPIQSLEPGASYESASYRVAVDTLLSTCDAQGGRLELCERPPRELGAVTRALRDAAEAGARLLIVDYLQLIGVKGADSAADQMRQVADAMQLVAFETNTTVFGLSQFNRATSFAGERPTVYGLAGSSAIENNADQVLLIDATEATPSDHGRDMKLLLAKNRHGPAVDIGVHFDTRTLRWSERDLGPDTRESQARAHGIHTGGLRVTRGGR